MPDDLTVRHPDRGELKLTEAEARLYRIVDTDRDAGIDWPNILLSLGDEEEEVTVGDTLTAALEELGERRRLGIAYPFREAIKARLAGGEPERTSLEDTRGLLRELVVETALALNGGACKGAELRDVVEAYVRLGGDLELEPSAPPAPATPDPEELALRAWRLANDRGLSTEAADFTAAIVRAALAGEEPSR